MTDGKRSQEQQQPVVGKKPTRDDLAQAVAAARDAATAAGDAANAAAVAADTALTAMEGEAVAESPLPEQERVGNRGGNPPRAQAQPQGDQGGRARRPTGPGAQETGHGAMQFGGRRAQEGPAAYEQFMAALKDPLRKAGNKVRVSDNAGWIKIEGMQGHKVYIAKTKTGVSRIESTLDPDLIEGASPPDRKNGRIASWIPARTESVAEAIELLATLTEPIAPPARGGGRSEEEYDDDREQGQRQR